MVSNIDSLIKSSLVNNGASMLMFDDLPTNVFKLLLNLYTQYNHRSGMCNYECHDGFITNLPISNLSQVPLSVESVFVLSKIIK